MANTTNWLSISSMSGSSGQTVLTLSAAKNLVGSAKTAEVTAYNPVYNISAKTYVSIEQYSPYITVNPLIIGVPGSGSTYSLNISANCSYTIAFPEIVSYYSTSAGTGNTTITFTVPSTTASTTLVGNIVVTDESGQFSTTARIEQYGDGVHITVDPSSIVIPSSGGSVTFTVSADCIYQVSTASGFFTVSPGSGYTGSTTFTVTANGENTGSTDYSGAITITAPGYQTTVSVVQKKPERRLIVGYWVTSTTEPTRVVGSDTIDQECSKIEYPDGTEISLSGTTGYTFPSTGMQYVYYTLTGNTVPLSFCDACHTVREVRFPNQITEINTWAFFGNSLTALTLPSNLEIIGSGAFNGSVGSPSYTSVTIPNSVSAITANAFRNNPYLSEIYVNRPTPATIGSNVFYGCASDYKIIVPCPYMEAYLSAWSAYSEHITCQDDTTLYFSTDTSNVAGTGETRTITILNGNINPNTIGLNFPSGSYVLSGNTIYVTYPQNTGSTSRSWTVTITAQTMDGVTLSNSYNITQNGIQTVPIPYTANTSLVDKYGEIRTVYIDTSGLIESSIAIGLIGGTGVSYSYNEGVIIITFPHNTDYNRVITLTITAITQDGNMAYANITYEQDGDIIIPTGDSRIVAVYNVTSTTNPTQILGDNYIDPPYPLFSKAELLDGTVIDLTARIGPLTPSFSRERGWYVFPHTGKQIVFYTLANPQEFVQTVPRYNPSLTGYDGFIFKGSALTDIVIPSSVVAMGAKRETSTGDDGGIGDEVDLTYGLFKDCTSLSSVTFSENITTMYSRCFVGCTSLSSLTIPSGVSGNIGNYCFSGSNITGITIPSGVTYLGYMAFGGCESLQNVSGMNSVSKYGGYCFYNCSALTHFNITYGVTNLSYGIFANCTSLTAITIPNTVQYFSGSTFSGCSSLSGISIPNSVSNLGSSCFNGCTSLQNVTLSESISTLGYQCFQYCSALTNITIPSGVTTLGDRSFIGCSSLSTIRCLPIIAPSFKTTSGDWAFDNIGQNGVLYYPNGSDYSFWLGGGQHQLGYYGWTGSPTL